MTKHEKYSFVLGVLLPTIEREGLTIKTHGSGELTLPPGDPSVTCFIQDMRQRLTSALQRPVSPSSPYGI
ncbi:hypothetical protein [Serratia liquefaciens]|uniref:Uncharacterized protein n=1 Tax=Serratia liquefaciens TaxID=614 RepID=A0ABX7D8X9_SERLI|nr:hypothetical protein [Serratia liquefaciens]QQU56460.1 hypothetical protein I6I38_05495 [Serratia liquefaciens]